MRFALVAGEASGDFLGGALIKALRAKFPDATFYGIAGPQMIAAGCDAIDTIDSLSVMGIGEILRDLPRLLKLRSRTAKRFAADRPAVWRARFRVSAVFPSPERGRRPQSPKRKTRRTAHRPVAALQRPA